MINYSIVMRSVNANLIEINTAKGRIKAARAKGETPNANDVALVKTEKQHAFAVAQYTDVMTIEKFARHIATHGCVYSRADISAILYLAVDCMREMLLEGRKVRLGDLGDFSVSLSSKGAESAEKFSAANITAVNVVWDCGPEFKNLLADAEFNLVASRSAQAALLKAIKSGSPVVDLGGGYRLVRRLIRTVLRAVTDREPVDRVKALQTAVLPTMAPARWSRSSSALR